MSRAERPAALGELNGHESTTGLSAYDHRGDAAHVNRLGVEWFETRSVSSFAHGRRPFAWSEGLRPSPITECDFRTTPRHPARW